MNTGRVEAIIGALNAAGVSVQVEILTEHSDPAWESKRDSVEVLNTEGKRLAHHADMQHNKNYGSLKANCAKIAEDTIKALAL